MNEASTSGARVLVVDDEPTNVQVLANALQDDYTVIFATNGDQALATAAADPQPDIILLDLLMPGMDGFELCARLKLNKSTADIPVIFVTMIDDRMNEERGFGVGAADYLPKPISVPLVRARVHLHLWLKQHRDFLERLVDGRSDELDSISKEARRLLDGLNVNAAMRSPRS